MTALTPIETRQADGTEGHCPRCREELTRGQRIALARDEQLGHGWYHFRCLIDRQDERPRRQRGRPVTAAGPCPVCGQSPVRCTAITTSGRRCRLPAAAGQPLCVLHHLVRDNPTRKEST
jgi:hypothetical protein